MRISFLSSNMQVTLICHRRFFLQWEAQWCPEMGIPTVQRQLYDLSGNINAVQGVGSISFQAVLNATTLCMTEVQAQGVTLTYGSASAALNLAVLGTFDVSAKFQSTINSMFSKIEDQVTTKIDDMALPKCKARSS